MRLDIANLLTSLRSPRPLRCGRGARRGNSTAAAEAAGAAIAEVFLAVRAGSGRNGRERGEGQSKGQNNLGHRDLLLDRCHVVSGRPEWPAARLSVPGASCGSSVGPTTACPPMSASAHGVLFSGSSGGTLEADMWSALYFPVDSLEISHRPPANASERRNPTPKGVKSAKTASGFAASRLPSASGAGARRTRDREIESRPPPKRAADS